MTEQESKTGCLTVCCIVLLLAGTMGVIYSLNTKNSQEKATSTPVEKEEKVITSHSCGWKLCVIDGDYESENSTKVRRYNYLLEILASKCSCKEINISDSTVATQQNLRDNYGVNVSNLYLLELANEDLRYGGEFNDYAWEMALICGILK